MSKKIEEPIDINKIDNEIEEKESVVAPDSELSFGETIENARTKIYESYRKQKKVSNITMLITVALVVGCFIMISQNISARIQQLSLRLWTAM